MVMVRTAPPAGGMTDSRGPVNELTTNEPSPSEAMLSTAGVEGVA